MSLKITWKAIRLSCFRPQSLPLDSQDHVTKPRLLLSDISDPGSTNSATELSNSLIGSNLHIFTLAELQVITSGFSSTNFLGEGGFGPVYKGFIDELTRPGLQAQPVAVKLLDLDGGQGHKEWMTELVFLGQLRHPYLVKLIGYCYEDEERLLVYEYMARGNLEKQLFKKNSIPLPWLTRIKVAVDAAKGLDFLHGEEKPVIYRDFKASNILLDSDYTAKLSDFGFAKDGPEGDKTHVTTRVMGTHGYAAPEYIMTGHLTTMSDVYSFGVVLLELLTGKKSLDKKRPVKEQNLVDWARPILKNPHKLDRIIDPRLDGQYSTEGAKKVSALAHQCLDYHPRARPTMSHVVKVLEMVLTFNDIPAGPFVFVVSSKAKNKDCDLTIDEKEPEKEEKRDSGYNRYRKARTVKHGVRSRAVFSDTSLFRTIGKEPWISAANIA